MEPRHSLAIPACRQRDMRRGLPAVAAILLAISYGAAASNSFDDCDPMTEAVDAHAAVPSLSVRIVDLDTSADGNSLGAATDRDEGDRDSVAPLLYLTPRVNSIVRDVFTVAGSSDSTDELSQTIDPEAAAPPPIAGSTRHRPDEEIETVAEEDDDLRPELSRLQRRMYRTDI